MDALEIYNKCIFVYTRILGEDHSSTLTIGINIA